jgi:DNA-binding MarR family transcriptional regulator
MLTYQMISVRDIPSPAELERFKTLVPEIEPDTVHLAIRLVSNVTRVVERLDAYLNREGMSFGRMASLMQLARFAPDGLTPSDLADKLGVTRATMTGLLDGLEREGFIARVPNPSDRRSHVVRVTPAGLEKMRAIIPAHMQRLSSVLAPLADRDRKQLSHLVDLLGEGLSNVPEP